MFQPLSPQMRKTLEESLSRQGVTPEQFVQAQRLAKAAGEKMCAAYCEVVGRELTPSEWLHVIGVEGGGRVVVAALREVTGNAGLYQESR